MIALCVCILAVMGLSMGLWSLNIGGTDGNDDLMNNNNNAMNNNNANLNDANLPNPVENGMETDV